MKAIWRVLVDAANRFVEDDDFAIASHITLSALTSLFPFLIFVAALAGFVGSANLADEASRLVFDAWPAAVARPIAEEVRNVLTAPRGGLLTVGAALSLYFSTSAIEAVRSGLNLAYGFKETRPWWLRRLQSAAFMIVGSIALLALAFLVVLGPLIWAKLVALAPGLAPFKASVTLARLAVATLLLAVAMFVAHLWLPAGKVRLAEAAPGATATLIASVAFSEAFGAYLNDFASRYVSTYAGLASVMIALMFLYSLATLFLAGGALNAAIIRARRAAS